MRRPCLALTVLIAAAAAVLPLAARADATGVIPPLPPGPYAVGCNNVVQDFTRVPSGATAKNYWEGFPDGNTPRYVTELLSDPANSMVVDVPIPDDRGLYGSFAAQTVAYVVLVCYPTSPANPRPDYPLPSGNVVPHMQRGAEAPIFADDAIRYPILLFSHGLTGSPISGDYIEALRLFASWGYAVVAPFHGDPRIANVKLEDFRDYLYALIHFTDFTAMQAVRPLSLSRALDAVLASPQFASHVDPSRIGGFGASLGGESLMLMGGAQLTNTIGQSSKQVTVDRRVSAAVGYVPYFGQDLYPAFGRDQKGLNGVTLPYLAISGTADTTAPIGATQQGFGQLAGTRQLVALTGVVHGFDLASAGDIFTWSLTFLAGQLSGDAVLRADSARMTSVAGGGEDILQIDYMAPFPEMADERVAVEYYNESLDHFFMTAEPAEAAMLDAGMVVPGWQRTGFDFKVRPAGDPKSLVACRFFGTPGVGPNSHFYTIDADECAQVRASLFWTFESIAFNADAPVANDCPLDRIPVMRLYNNGMGGQASHRFTTSHSEARETAQLGWTVEGNVFCAIP